MFYGAIRIVLAVAGALLFLGGLLVAVTGAPQEAVQGIPLLVGGGVLIVAIVLEKTRYRSEEADREAEPPGPGGGEIAGGLEPRFEPTDEVFVDPTSKRRMRVFLDRQTGERRYRAES